MLKFVNNEDTQKATISFSRLEEPLEEKKDSETTDAIGFNEDKIKVH